MGRHAMVRGHGSVNDDSGDNERRSRLARELEAPWTLATREQSVQVVNC